MIPEKSIFLKGLGMKELDLATKTQIFMKSLKEKTYISLPPGRYYLDVFCLNDPVYLLKRYETAEQVTQQIHIALFLDTASVITRVTNSSLLQDAFIEEINTEMKYIKCKLPDQSIIFVDCFYLAKFFSVES